MSTVTQVRRAFGDDAKLFTFTMTEKGIKVKGKKWVDTSLWEEHNQMVQRELNGKYNDAEKVWYVPAKDERPVKPQGPKTEIDKTVSRYFPVNIMDAVMQYAPLYSDKVVLTRRVIELSWALIEEVGEAARILEEAEGGAFK